MGMFNFSAETFTSLDFNCLPLPAGLSGAVTTANPAYSFSALVSEWTPLNGSVGELATASVTWPISGVITKTTA
jgi:hypothetical protein